MAATPFARSNISDLTDRVALITGASSGIGRYIAIAYAAAGAYVVIADITPNPPTAPLAEEAGKDRDIEYRTPTFELLNTKWPGQGGKDRSKYVNCDVTQAASVEAAVKSTVESYGRLDIMVNNAGVILETSHTKPTFLHETDPDLYEKEMAINARGVWLGMKYCITQMLAQDPHPTGDRGWIINMASIFGLVGSPGLTSYCASKGAVTNLTRAAAIEYAEQKIHINSIHPGYCDTPLLEKTRKLYGSGVEAGWNALHPWGRICWPEDVAKMAVFAAGDGVAFTTGQQFVVDGGYVAR